MELSAGDLFVLTPFLVLAAGAAALLLLAAFRRSEGAAAAFSGTALALSFASLFWIAPSAPRDVEPLLVMDGFSLYYLGLAIGTAAAVAALARPYLAGRGPTEEFHALLLLATLGAALLVASAHLAAFFLALELLSVSLYVLIAYLRASDRGIEAALKYLVLASTSSAFLLFGMALLYAETGTLELDQLAVRLAEADGAQPVFVAGLALVTVGFGFKLAVVPFHMWTPDVYEGAPAPVAAFVATVSKGAVFALLLRFAAGAEVLERPELIASFSAIAALSMLLGNLLALLQQNVKRVLAYSSIAHLGYLLVAFIARGEEGARAIAYYLAAYSVTMLCAFGVVGALSRSDREAASIDDYRGLFWRRPALAAILTTALLSLAGIPLTAGFIAKFSIVSAGVDAARWALVIILIAGSAIGLFYYLRIVVALYRAPPASAAEAPPSALGLAVLSILAVALVGLGVYPGPLLELIDATALVRW